MLRFNLFLLTVFSSLPVLAQSPSPVASASPGAKIVEAIEKASSIIPSGVPQWLVYAVGVLSSLGVLDLVLRRYPTLNPKSLLIALSSILKSLDVMILKLDKFVESILGQNVQK